MKYLIAIAVSLALAGCSSITQGIGVAGTSPGGFDCGGKGVVSIIGSVGPSAAANGSVTFDCGPGAYFRQGMPASEIGPATSSSITIH
jgi:hypothetical protein